MRRKLLTLAILSLLTLNLLAVPGAPAEETGGGGAGARAACFLLSVAPENSTRSVNTSLGQYFAQYGFRIENTGDSSLPLCNLTLCPWTFTTWSCFFIPSVPFEINPGENKTILLTIYPDKYAMAKRYTFQIRGVEGCPTNAISINLDILPWVEVEVRPPVPKPAYPGETVELDFEILNEGNIMERFCVASIEAGITGVAPRLKDGSSLTDAVPVGGYATKTVVVEIPEDVQTTEGTAGIRLSMSVYCMSNSSKRSTSTTYIEVLHVYEIALAVSPSTAAVYPGESANITLTVFNLGNGPDTVSLSTSAAFNDTGWSVSLDADELDLSAARSATTRLMITPPPGAPGDTNYTLWVTARSRGPPPPKSPVERSESLTVYVRRAGGVHIADVDYSAPRPVEPGEAVEFRVNVSNTGNFEDFLELTTLEMPRNWSVGLRPGWSLRLAPLSSVEVTVLIESSSDFINSPYGEHVVLLQATAARTGLVQNLSFRVPVRRVGSWELLAISSTIVELNLSQSTSVSIPVSIRSNGNFRDTLSLSIEGGAARWASLPFGSLSLSPGEEEVFGVLIDVPTDTPTGTYGLLLLASSSGGTGISRELALSIVVSGRGLAPAGPEILLFVPQSELRLRGGGEAELTVRISCTSGEVANLSLNATTSHPSELSVRLLSGPLNLRAGQSSSWRLLVSAARHRGPSLHATLFLTAVGDGYVGDTRSLSVTVEPAGEPGPAVSMEYLLPLLAILLALGGIALGWNELVLLALTNLLLPLYSRIRREEVLDRYLRGKIHGYLIANPGDHYNSIKVHLGIKNGTLAYHLRILEREGFVKAVRDGLYKRFYPVEARVTRRAGEFTPIQEVVLQNIRGSPGITQTELARRMGVSAQVVNYHVHQLAAAGAIRLERSGRETLCYIGRTT